MPKYDSPRWNTVDGVCEKHWLPQIPCPACIAEKDADLEIKYDQMDIDFLLFQEEEEKEDK